MEAVRVKVEITEQTKMFPNPLEGEDHAIQSDIKHSQRGRK